MYIDIMASPIWGVFAFYQWVKKVIWSTIGQNNRLHNQKTKTALIVRINPLSLLEGIHTATLLNNIFTWTVCTIRRPMHGWGLQPHDNILHQNAIVRTINRWL